MCFTVWISSDIIISCSCLLGVSYNLEVSSEGSDWLNGIPSYQPFLWSGELWGTLLVLMGKGTLFYLTLKVLTFAWS